MAVITRSSVSQARQRLIALMQEIGFGRIENLDVVNDEPVLDPAPCVARTIVLDRETGLAPARPTGNFELKDPVVRLFRLFDEYRSLRVVRLEVKGGLPCHMEILGLARAA